MKLQELNEINLNEQSFSKVSDELETHITSLEADIKEVNLNIVRLMTKKANKVIDQLEAIIKSKVSILTIGEKVDKYSKQLNILKSRFIDLRKKFKDNIFEKEIMAEVDEILKDLIYRIDSVVDDGEEAVKKISAEISRTSVPKANRSGKKVPAGIAQDLKSRRTFISKK